MALILGLILGLAMMRSHSLDGGGRFAAAWDPDSELEFCAAEDLASKVAAKK